MDTFLLNPFRSQIHEAAASALTAQQELMALAGNQMKLVAGQTTALLELTRAGFEAQVSASLALSKRMVDGLAVKAEA